MRAFSATVRYMAGRCGRITWTIRVTKITPTCKSHFATLPWWHRA